MDFNINSVVVILIISQLNRFISSDDNNSILRKRINQRWSVSYGNSTPNRQYDFIIVGAGPAGCVLANRLTEIKEFTVLLLEVGKPELPLVNDVPIGSPNFQSTDFNWGYATEPQEKACLSMNDNRCNWPHGRGIGGSSLINYMIYTRGNRRDFDRWEAMGNPGWSYMDVLPYFKKSETSTLANLSYNAFHGFDGPLWVEDQPYRSPISNVFLASAKASGYSFIDYNAAEQIGVSYIQQNTKYGWRVTAGKAYLESIRNRPNLHIIPYSWVTKILLNADSNRVNGVRVLINRKVYEIQARKEVIVSAGSFQSPKLLMLSGIGPRDHLLELGIKVRADLPVGQTLYEHMSVFGPIYTINDVDGLKNVNDLIKLQIIFDFYAGKGPMTNSGVESLLYMKTNNSASSDPGYPDIELIQSFQTIAFDTAPGTRRGIRLSSKTYDAVFKPLINRRAFQYLPMLLHPKSKGYLKLKSSNPFHHPLFYPNFFDDERDIDTLREGIREAQRITNQLPFKEIGAKLYEAKVPGCENTIFDTDNYWNCYIKHLSATLHHQVSTCKMGPKTDNSTVVDATLRVHGFSNLRIADVSIIPEPPSGHTAAYSYMIGERVADLIKNDWIKDTSNFIRQKRQYFDWQKIPKMYNRNLSIKNKTGQNITEEVKVSLVNSTKQYDYGNNTNSNINEIKTILWASGRNSRPSKVDDKNISDHFHIDLNSTTEISTTILLDTTTNTPVTVLGTITEPTTTSNVTDNIITLITPEIVPSVNEDTIKAIVLNDADRYGFGMAKPRNITNELNKIKSINYTDLNISVEA